MLQFTGSPPIRPGVPAACRRLHPRRALPPGPLCLALLTLSGCSRDDQIRSYSAPKDPPASSAGMQSGDGAPAASSNPPAAVQTPATPGQESVEWTLPAGWKQFPGEGMRFATLILEEGAAGAGPLELRVTPLGFGARDPLANVNRWREQIGLDAIDAADLGNVAREIQVDGRTAHVVHMVGRAEGASAAPEILGAIVPGNERVWFFLVMDRSDRVGRFEKPFDEFLQSVRVVGAQVAAGIPPGHPPVEGLPAGHPPLGAGAGSPPATGEGGMPADMAGSIPAPPAGGPELRWKTPPGWKEQPGQSAFRVAGFTVAAAEGSGEVTITRFPGGVGGLLANINRWRGQVGLQPVADVAQQPLEPLEVDALPAQLLDLVGPGAAGSAPRLLVVLVPRDDMTWFVKMSGPSALVQPQKRVFVDFARSIRFEVGGP